MHGWASTNDLPSSSSSPSVHGVSVPQPPTQCHMPFFTLTLAASISGMFSFTCKIQEKEGRNSLFGPYSDSRMEAKQRRGKIRPFHCIFCSIKYNSLNQLCSDLAFGSSVSFRKSFEAPPKTGFNSSSSSLFTLAILHPLLLLSKFGDKGKTLLLLLLVRISLVSFVPAVAGRSRCCCRLWLSLQKKQPQQKQQLF